MLVNKRIIKPWLWTIGLVSVLALGRLMPEFLWVTIQSFAVLYTVVVTFLQIVSSLFDDDSYGDIDNLDKE